jgi:ATP-dependent DNA helicase RecG
MGEQFEQLNLFERHAEISSKEDHMGIETSNISKAEASKIINFEEGQFGDVKAIEIKPADLTKAISALANSDGGDIYVGVDETGTAKARSWRGFKNPEAANGHLQCFEPLFPLGQDFVYEFIACQDEIGVVLHIQINKTKAVVRASNRIPYIRRGAMSLPADTAEMVKQLEYNKGVSSFETDLLNIAEETITNSIPVIEFMLEVVPQQSPEKWLRKQLLLVDGRPSVGGTLLFAEEPQAALPKRCGIKIYRYKTSEGQGFREALAFTPITIEGWLYRQIREAVEKTTEIIESIPKMGADALEAIEYPSEALHEIITNAVLHRDYNIADDVHIRVFDNRVEVQSPGKLPAHITVANILEERFARNGTIVRLLNKYPDPPNKDVGEGLNTAFSAMQKLGLKRPTIEELDNSVLVTLRHEKLASPEEAIMDYLAKNETIRNKTAREITYINGDYVIKKIFGEMVEKGMIEQVPGTNTGGTKYRLPSAAGPINPTP